MCARAACEQCSLTLRGPARRPMPVPARLCRALTPWHSEIAPGRPHPGAPDTAANQLAAEHGAPPVTGAAVLSGEMLYGAPHPLDVDKAAQIATRLGG